MGRQLAFDRDEKLKQAMRLFWSKGYEATSMQELVETLAINRFSLYNTFGDKRRLFLEALERYGQSIIRPLVEPLLVQDAGLKEIREYLKNLEEGLTTSSGNFGCFFQNAVAECGPLDEGVRLLVEASFSRLEGLLEQALQRSLDRGELNRLTDPRQGARFLITHIQGVILLRKATRDPQRVTESLRFLQAELQSW